MSELELQTRRIAAGLAALGFLTLPLTLDLFVQKEVIVLVGYLITPISSVAAAVFVARGFFEKGRPRITALIGFTIAFIPVSLVLAFFGCLGSIKWAN